MAQDKSSKDPVCLCKNVKRKDSIVLFAPDEKRPIKVWHKDCPVHPMFKVIEEESEKSTD